ncbi:MAG: hypothetical protein H0Z33_03320 [Bacillaceae bacterium]|nr:hypothetical protein [Bacillaceae bacterium]
MLFFLLLLILIAVIILLVWQWNQSPFGRRTDQTATGYQDPDHQDTHQQTFDIQESNQVEPETPHPFGYKCSWLAIKTSDPKQVIQKLNLGNVREANWSQGLEAAYEMDGEVFVSPVLDEWVLVIGQSLPTAGDEGHPDEITPLIQDLGSQFEEVHYFSTHRVVEYHAWARVQNGEIVRAYAYLGESGETIWDKGDVTEAEKELDIPGDYPDEEDVLRLAAKWSVDPAFEEATYDSGIGWIGELNRGN